MKNLKNIHRLAGASLAGCVGLGAIGQHKVKPWANEYQMHAYSTANRDYSYTNFDYLYFISVFDNYY